MKGWVEKLARDATRLAFWRKPVEAGSEAAASSAPAAASNSATAATPDSVPKASWFARLKQKLRRHKEQPAPATAVEPAQDVVETTPTEADASPAPPPIEAPPPPPPLKPQELEEMLELSDSVAQPIRDDQLFGDDTPEEAIPYSHATAESVHSDEAAAEAAPAEFAQSDIAQTDAAHAEAEPANSASTKPSQTKASPTTPPSVEATPAENSENPKTKLVRRLLGILSKKWVLIPSVSVAMLAIMGTLSFMLMQSKQATYELQAELASAKKQLKQFPLKPEVAPPVRMAHQDVSPHDVDHAQSSPETAAHDQTSPQAAAGSPPTPYPNIDMDCDVSDKASVAKNLKNCIEAFNQATAR